MARKTAGSLEEQREALKKKYKRGRKADKVAGLTDLDELSISSLAFKRAQAVLLKASDFSTAYIADACGVSKGVVRAWFDEDEMREHVDKMRESLVEGAVTLLRSYAIELVEMLVEIARTTSDEKIALQAITEALDRMGLSKVNKSESAASITERHVHELTDSTGLMETLKAAPPEVQQKAAEHMESLIALAAEHTDMEVDRASSE